MILLQINKIFLLKFLFKFYLDFYGTGSEYSVFAGKDITRAIALWSKEQSEIERGMDIVSNVFF